MIPKIIHFCWLGSEMSEDLKRNIEGWKEIMPNYQFIQWDLRRFPKGKSIWVDQACDKCKYAFASDYIRLFALFNYGGIYLDTDVRVLKPLDCFLDLPYFLGMENNKYGLIGTGTLGFTKHHPFIKQLLDRYDTHTFINKYGEMELEPNTVMFRRYIESQMECHIISNKQDFLDNPSVFNVFTSDFFCPKNSETQELELSDNTYVIHDFAASWVQPSSSVRKIDGPIGHVQKIVTKLMASQKCVILSNTMYERHFYKKFDLDTKGPLWDAYLSEEDFEELANNKDSLLSRHISFIDCRDSKCFNKNEFYPIAKIDGTEIELHFKKCYTREQANSSWEDGINNINRKQVVFLSCSKAPSRKIDYLICLKILLGEKIIRI